VRSISAAAKEAAAGPSPLFLDPTVHDGIAGLDVQTKWVGLKIGRQQD